LWYLLILAACVDLFWHVQLLGSMHPDLAMSLNNLGGLYLDWSKYAQAEPCYLRYFILLDIFFVAHNLWFERK